MTEEDEEDEGLEGGIRGGVLLHPRSEISTLIPLPINKISSNYKDQLVFSTVSKSTKANLTTAVVLSLITLNGKNIKE